jgi:ATP-dependent 26S proteasome regulatory subunit
MTDKQKPPDKQKGTENDGNNNDDGDEKQKKRKGISLCGLLNAIDTARKEGVILIMTTNKPEDLDQALMDPVA